MLTKLHALPLAILCSALVACSGNDDGGGTGGEGGNDDPPGPGGIELVDISTEQLPLSMTSAQVVARSDAYSDFYAVITNDGSETLCFIQLDPLSYIGHDGNEIEESLSYVEGDNRQLSTSNTNTCLLPGQSGELVDIAEIPLGDIATIEYAFDARTTENTDPDTIVELEGGTPTINNEPGGDVYLSGTIVNVGGEDAIVGTTSLRFIIKDATGAYVDSTFGNMNGDVTLAPGDTLDFETLPVDLPSDWEISSYVDWDDPDLE